MRKPGDAVNVPGMAVHRLGVGVNFMPHDNSTIPLGLCQCGCGQATRIIERNCSNPRRVRGEFSRFISGHQSRKSAVEYLIDPETGCWVWQRARSRNGYGNVVVSGRNQCAHKMIYERTHGPVPLGMELDHLCRNRACVNPDHLEPVTSSRNKRRRPATILSETDVQAIKQLLGSMPQKDIAKKYGVHRTHISNIAAGRIWDDVAMAD